MLFKRNVITLAGNRDFRLLLLLLAVNFACYWPSLYGYFHNDDLMQLPFLYKVYQGHPELLLQNFASVWMGRDYQLFYRPLIEVSLAFDYGLWKVNPFGYHLSNILYQVVASFFLFLITRRLLRDFGDNKATQAGLFTAVLFSIYPLHPEVVSWIIGRVDGLCCAFYMIAIWSFLKWLQDKINWALLLALFTFTLSLLCKEVAAGLPLALVFMTLANLPPPAKLPGRLIDSFKITWMFWGVLALYLLVRWVILGTVMGGYAGALGDIWNATVLERLFQYDSFWLLVYPFNRDLFTADDWLCLILRAVYILLAMLVLLRLGLNEWNRQTTTGLLLALAWFVSCFLPVMQVWNISPVLLGSRYIYLASAPFCMGLSILLLPLSVVATARLQRITYILGYCLLSALISVYALTVCRNNSVWLLAGQQMRVLQQQLQQIVAGLPPYKSLYLVDFPQQYHGAHMFYHPDMFFALLQPPLCNRDLSRRLYMMEPMFHDDEELINKTQLRQISAAAQNEMMFWHPQQMRFLPQAATPVEDTAYEELPLKIVPSMSGGSYEIELPPGLRSAGYDFLQLETQTSKPDLGKQGKIQITWKVPHNAVPRDGKLEHRIVIEGPARTDLIAISEYKSWTMAGPISGINLKYEGAGGSKLLTAKLLPGKNLLPVIWADGRSLKRQNNGTFVPSGHTGSLCYDVSAITGAQAAVIEWTRSGVFFRQYTGTMRDTRLLPQAAGRVKLDSLKGCWQFSTSDLPAHTWIQVRVAAIDAAGKVCGYVSDPVNLTAGTY